MKTATKSLGRRQIKKCRRELRWIELTIARLEVQRVELGITHPEVIRWLSAATRTGKSVAIGARAE